MNDDILALRSRIQELEQENRQLRALLADAGIPCQPELKHPEELSLIRPVTERMANRFFSFFWGRQDVYAKRSVNKKTGKVGYYPQCKNFWSESCPKRSGKRQKCPACQCRMWKKLEINDLCRHLEGNAEDTSDVIGIYPLFPDGTCRFLVFDFDDHENPAERESRETWREEADALRAICTQNRIDVLTERSRSGQGAHIWIFFDQPVPAYLARRFGAALLEKGAESVNLKTFHTYDRMLPAQDHMPEGGLGNLIALPLQGHALRNGNSAFVDEAWNPWPDQWAVLLQQRKLGKEDLERCLAQWQSGPVCDTGETDETQHPWQQDGGLHDEDVDGCLKVALSDGIYLSTHNLKPRIQNQFRRMAAFYNPVFFRNQALGLSNYQNSRFIYLGEDVDGYIHLPIGLWEPLRERLQATQITAEVDDERTAGSGIDVTFAGELRPSQLTAVETLLRYENGVLSAATAFGKTVVCTRLIAERRERTLILLESSALLEQWKKAIETFLVIREEPPSYHTKTGRVRKRKSAVGWLQGSHDSLTGIIDIAMVSSLSRREHPMLGRYGMIIVDECHHAASDTMIRVLRRVRARYIYGVTATPLRGDGLQRINQMLLGPIRYRYTAKERAREQGILHLVCPRFTRTVNPFRYGEKLHPNDAYGLLRRNDDRDGQILSDVRKSVEQGRTPVILSRFADHAAKLHEALNGAADHVILLTGTKTGRAQREVWQQLEHVQETETVILVATGQLIGEGFDYPRLDTLFLATPVAWKGVVEQYAGRLNRDYPGKESVIIYDYVDSHIPMFERMYGKRLRAYRQIGYEISTVPEAERQQANAIYDMDNYSETYLGDLRSAREEIVISSQTVNTRKVEQLLALLRDRQDAVLRVTVVTWHPDVWLYGKSERRMELLERLRRAGIHILTVEDNCEHYAVIDREVVWYGSMNLLSREDAEDNLMRLCDKSVAAELLEMTFGTAKELSVWPKPMEAAQP